MGDGRVSEPPAGATGAAKMTQPPAIWQSDNPYGPGRNRRHRPYPVVLPLRYQSRWKGRVVAAGTGLTVAIGGRVVVFVAQHLLTVGSLVELSIDWPAKLMEGTPLRLHVRGAVRKLDGESILVAIKGYVFKIRPKPAPPPFPGPA